MSFAASERELALHRQPFHVAGSAGPSLSGDGARRDVKGMRSSGSAPIASALARKAASKAARCASSSLLRAGRISSAQRNSASASSMLAKSLPGSPDRANEEGEGRVLLETLRLRRGGSTSCATEVSAALPAPSSATIGAGAALQVDAVDCRRAMSQDPIHWAATSLAFAVRRSGASRSSSPAKPTMVKRQ